MQCFCKILLLCSNDFWRGKLPCSVTLVVWSYLCKGDQGFFQLSVSFLKLNMKYIAQAIQLFYLIFIYIINYNFFVCFSTAKSLLET